jgi:signal transduction histidine kinase
MSDEAAPSLPDLVAVMTHDLKNPLAALVTNLHFVRESIESADPEVVEAVSDSVILCESLDRLIRALDLVGHPPVSRARAFSTNLDSLLTELHDKLTPHAAAQQIALEHTPSAGLVVEVDRDLFGVAIENAIVNALESAPRRSAVHVSIEQDAASATVVVRDARPQSPEAQASAPNLPDRKRLQLRYGRGIALLAARIAAERAGGVYATRADDRGFEIRLTAPFRSGGQA